MFTIKLDLPKIDENLIRAQVRAAMLGPTRRAAKKAQKYFDSTVETWAHKPKFEPKVHRGADAVTMTVSPEGGGNPQRASGATLSAAEIWAMLNSGTKVRKVTLRPGFSPKTTPGRIRAQPGHNPGAFHQGKNFPGQRPRDWVQNIAWIVIPEWYEDFEQELAKAINRGWGK